MQQGGGYVCNTTNSIRAMDGDYRLRDHLYLRQKIKPESVPILVNELLSA